ncbi:hypothetical protein AD948_05735 [Acetobacter senegalensis]|uniref:Uncharacterized protein n=1 Tax=Acetobacter senegalensis TaxID=446692 RepID=A0A149U497_9PROT|nr:hypothetical protein [Acetobacter senegalensis]KXV60251.1 hypothetical protein AD948_05735 [Acetobacter senegalensis]
MTDTNWPNPERPGVPMYPERDGWHLLKRIDEDGFDVVGYKKGKWISDEGNKPLSSKYIVRDYKYIAPVLTPAQIAEMLAAERERCAKVCEDTYEKSGRDFEYLGCNDAAEQIRNLGAEP